jgi:putative Ca2+/H+ antiporter (TMEM165/GDT1 family)
MLEDINTVLIVSSFVFITLSIFLKLRYSLLIFLIVHVAFLAISLGGGQAGGWLILLYSIHYLKAVFIILFVVIAIKVIKVSWLDSREPDKPKSEKSE